MPTVKTQAIKKAVTTKEIKIAEKPALKKTSALSVPVFSLTGKTSTELSLPKEIFGVEVNEQLLAQAVRIYSTNQKTQPGSTKGRGEVEGSTAKIFKQKGTGRARHGSVRAPIFVGGGIVFGPKPRRTRLSLPQKMRKAAIISALSSKALDKKVFGVSGLEKASGKTKEMAGLINKLVEGKKQPSTLIILEEKADNVVRASKNIPQITTLPLRLLNAYEILKHDVLLVTKEAVEKLQEAGKKE